MIELAAAWSVPMICLLVFLVALGCCDLLIKLMGEAE